MSGMTGGMTGGMSFLSAAAGLDSSGMNDPKFTSNDSATKPVPNNDICENIDEKNELAALLLGVRASTPNSAAPGSRSHSPHPGLKDSSTKLNF